MGKEMHLHSSFQLCWGKIAPLKFAVNELPVSTDDIALQILEGKSESINITIDSTAYEELI